MDEKLGIGIITYNRCELLEHTISKIFEFTSVPFDFVVADDGSSDNTIEFLKNRKIPFVSGHNKGISWNRNRALWYLKEEKKCQQIIIFEDDCFPSVFGWEKEWVSAINSYGHVNYMPEITLEVDNDISSGTGTSQTPYIAPMHQAFCVGYHCSALSIVGYLDIRFKKYGEEHVDHTHRFLRAGYGGLLQHLRPERGQLYYIRGGLDVLPSESHGNHEIASYNQRVHDAIQNEPIYRAPWRTDKQLFEFREEIERSFPRPPTPLTTNTNSFDAIISLGGTDTVKYFIDSHFHVQSPSIFSDFITPFHTMIELFNHDFKQVFSTSCLYGYHDALRCRDSLIIYHKCLDKDSKIPATVELFHEQLDAMKNKFQEEQIKLDNICNGDQKILFVRDWKDTLYYEGMHKPLHAKTPDFLGLFNAIAKRYPNLDFTILFTNFGDSYINHKNIVFSNIETGDVDDIFLQASSWSEMFGRLGINLA